MNDQISSQPLQYFLYARKSSEDEERQVQSIESQLEEAKKRYPELKIVGQPLTEAASAFKPYNRPVFTQMLQRIQSGEADGIIAWHPDRLARNPIDAGQITYYLDTGVIKDLKFTSFHFENSAEGKMLLGFMLSQSKYFSDKLSKDIRRGNLTKLQSGWLPGQAPPGYRNFRTDDNRKLVVPDEPRFTLIRKAWDLLLTGIYTTPQILDKLNNEWGYRNRNNFPMARSTLYTVFTNQFYAGLMVRKEGKFEGKYQKLVTLEEFDRVQAILGTKGKPRAKNHEFAFTGMIRCGECGCMITAEEKEQAYCYQCHKKFILTAKRQNCPSCNKSAYSSKEMRLLDYTFYHCTKRKTDIKCSQPSIRVEELEKQITDLLRKIEVPETFSEWAIKWLKWAHQQEVQDHNAQLEALQMAYKTTQTKLDNLVDMRMNTLITDEQYISKKEAVEKERTSLKEQLDGFEHRINLWAELTEQTFNFAVHARRKFTEGSLEEKRQVLSSLGSNLVLTDKNLAIQPLEPFRLIAGRLAGKPEMVQMLEPEEVTDIPVDKKPIHPILQDWCWDLDSNQGSLAARVLQTRVLVHSTIPA